VLTCIAKFGIVVPFLYFSMRALNFSTSTTLSLHVGVSHNPYPVSSVRGIEGASWNNKRPCGVSFAFQVRKHLVEPHVDVASNIFKQAPSGPDGSQEPMHFRPEVTVIFLASSLPGETEWLAGVSPDNAINSSKSICLQLFTTQLPYICVARHAWPVLPQHGAAVRVNLTERDGLKSARPFEAQREAADS
jgi:hypothetical protein